MSHQIVSKGTGSRSVEGFTLIELLVVISIIALLIGILLPTLSSARELARGMDCGTRIRQLALGAEIYADESDDFYPPRATVPKWPAHFIRTYQTPELLKCPSELDPPGNVVADSSDEDDRHPRSYIFNGFNDLTKEPAWTEADTTAARRVQILQPSNTILFGEKEHDYGGYYVDIRAGDPDDWYRLEQSRHGNAAGSNNNGSGYSNYAFGDTSVRTLRFGEASDPTVLWAVLPQWRDTPLIAPPAAPPGP